jgi:hypothetical protein
LRRRGGGGSKTVQKNEDKKKRIKKGDQKEGRLNENSRRRAVREIESKTVYKRKQKKKSKMM